MSFISIYLKNKISEMSKKILEENNYYSLILDKPVHLVQRKGIWEIIGVNDFGFFMLKSDISVNFSMVPGPEMIEIYEQIKAGEYKFKNR